MHNLRAALLMVLAMAAFAAEDALLKGLSGRIPTGQLLAVIGFAGMVVFGPWIAVGPEGLRLRHLLRPQGTARAADILDDDLLAQFLRHPFRDDAAHDIGGPPGGEGDHQRDLAFGELGGRSPGKAERQGRAQQDPAGDGRHGDLRSLGFRRRFR